MSFNRRPLDRRSRRQLTIFGGLLVASMVMMATSGTIMARRVQNAFNYAMDPIVNWTNDAVDWVDSMGSTLLELDRLRQEIDELRAENDTLRDELARLPAVSHLDDDWTKITQTQQSLPYQSLRARVLVRDLSDVRPRVFIVDKGSRDGVRVGQVVVANGGALVGRVDSVEDVVSTVKVIDDKTSVVIGREESSGAIGPVQGQVGGLLRMEISPPTQSLETGQVVVTAGESVPGSDIRSPYPPGLLIGTLSQVTRGPDSEDGIVTPAADLHAIIFLLIITNYEGGIPIPSPSPSGSPAPTPGPS
jgi:rod shape-determining protein MreC